MPDHVPIAVRVGSAREALAGADGAVRVRRATLLASILGSSITALDATVVNVALPAIARDVGGGLSTQLWVVNAYALTLGALVLVAGSLGDVFGQRTVLTVGLVGFGATSLACALAPTAEALITARALQGIAGALMMPTALALIVATFDAGDRGRAIGQWTAWSGVAAIAGPLVGGQLVSAASWRWVFFINLPLVALTVALVLVLVPRSRARTHRSVDIVGGAFAALGLGGPVYALIEQPRLGWSHPGVVVPFVVGAGLLAAFVARERSMRDPMLPLGLFRGRNFTVGNVQTLLMYAGLSIMFFLLGLFLQQVSGWSAVEAGLTTLPTTLVLFALSGRFGALADRYGPRFFMAAGPLVGAAGLLLLLRVGADVDVAGALLPALIVFSVGLAMTIAPLTATVLAGVDLERAGIASAVNNAVARVAGLAGVAALGPLLGGELDVGTFHVAVAAAAALIGAAGVLGAVWVRDPERKVLARHCAGGQLTGAPRDAAMNGDAL